MLQVLLKRLRQSEIGWFYACRKAGRETAHVRGLNLDAHLVRKLLGRPTNGSLQVTCVWHDGAGLVIDRRPIRRQGKNWRLTGTAVRGDRFMPAGEGDILLLLFDPSGDTPVLAWDLISAAEPLDNDVLSLCNDELGARSSMRVLAEAASTRVVRQCLQRLPLLRDVLAANGHADPAVHGLRTGLPAIIDSADDSDSAGPYANGSTGWGTWPSVRLVAGHDSIPPDLNKAIEALRSIGYTFEQAIADIIDNCVDARARTVLVRTTIRVDGTLRIAVADDGTGMDATTLKEAMRIGSGSHRSRQHLGKYGLGLKLASFSHAKSLTIASCRSGNVAGRRLTVDGFKHDGRCDRLSDEFATAILRSNWQPVTPFPHGTVVVWDEVDRLQVTPGTLERTLRRLRASLGLHLGMCFHRFLTRGQLRLVIDRQDEGEPLNRMGTVVDPLDPFKYDHPGHPGYPKDFTVMLPFGQVRAQAHIWPPRSVAGEYKLDGANHRQGFYFYRNDRLIQAGGWNGWRETQDPHLSLARIRVDLDTALDSHFSLDVKKAGIKTPPMFAQALRSTVFDDGIQFEVFLKDAEAAYRQRTDADADIPYLPSTGLARSVRDRVREFLPKTGDRYNEIAFAWAAMPDKDVVGIDRDGGQILINQQYRTAILNGGSGSKNDAPLIKLLLFFLLQPDFGVRRPSEQRKQWMRMLNETLYEAIRSIEASNA